MKNENYIVIQGWMVNELCLKGNDLLIYALIYGFTQDGENWFEGSLNYVSKAIGGARSTVQASLKRLEGGGDIIKETRQIKGVTFTIYKSVPPTGIRYGGIPESGKGGVPKSGTLTKPIIHNAKNHNKKEGKKALPSYEEFSEYAKDKAVEMNLSLDEEKLKLKYEAWKEGGWRTGKGVKIKNWKTTLLNTLPYLKKEKEKVAQKRKTSIEDLQQEKDNAKNQNWNL